MQADCLENLNMDRAQDEVVYQTWSFLDSSNAELLNAKFITNFHGRISQKLFGVIEELTLLLDS